jgi:hypothetical protein
MSRSYCVSSLDLADAPSSTFPNTVCPLELLSGKFRRYTPVNIIVNPQSSEMVFVMSVMLKPWKRTKDAVRTAVVKVT